MLNFLELGLLMKPISREKKQLENKYRKYMRENNIRFDETIQNGTFTGPALAVLKTTYQ